MPSTRPELRPSAASNAAAGWGADTMILPPDTVLMDWDTALPTGTRLREYEIRRVIGQGGAGNVYQAWDHTLRRLVAVKEYLPEGLAVRGAPGRPIEIAAATAAIHAAGLRAFVAEARVLASVDHPALVKVYRFWDDAGTAYMVMPFYDGPSLKSVLDVPGRLQDEAEVRSWLKPLLGAVSALHTQNDHHGHIGPDSILLTAQGPVLLDRGSAGRTIAVARSGSHGAALKHGYAALEQYTGAGVRDCGPWTDFYALAAVAYRAMTGISPPPAVERAGGDRIVPLVRLGGRRCTAAFAASIDRLLGLRADERPHSASEFRQWVRGMETHASPLELEDAFDPMAEPFDLGPAEVTEPPEPTEPTEPTSLTEPNLTQTGARHGDEHRASPADSQALDDRRQPAFNASGSSRVGRLGWHGMHPRRTGVIAASVAVVGVAAAVALWLQVAGPGVADSGGKRVVQDASAAGGPAPPVRPAAVEGSRPGGFAGSGTRNADTALQTPAQRGSTGSPGASARRSATTPEIAARPNSISAPLRCEDLLHEATLRRLTDVETGFLKRECR